MNEELSSHRRGALIAFAVCLLVVGLAIVFTGGKTTTILSTVGAAIPPGEANVGTSVGAAPEDPAAGSNSGATVADAAGRPPTLLIVRTGTLELEVASLSSTVTAASNVVSAAGGYVSGSEESAASDSAGASVVYRIPASAWDATLAGIRNLATTVRHQQVGTEEVTGQVVDLGARIANLRTTEAALQSIMARATKISDVLDVQKQLTATRGEIERSVADKAQLEGRAAFGSLTVTFNLPAPPAVTTASKGWDPAADVDRATGRLISIGQALVSLAIVLVIVWLPLLVGGSVLVAVAWQLYRLGRWVMGRRAPEGASPV